MLHSPSPPPMSVPPPAMWHETMAQLQPRRVSAVPLPGPPQCVPVSSMYPPRAGGYDAFGRAPVPASAPMPASRMGQAPPHKSDYSKLLSAYMQARFGLPSKEIVRLLLLSLIARRQNGLDVHPGAGAVMRA
mmetsp:Transcript_11845/g.30910  ORF Transcript_11845/g.30910 Transcript_11845/m.30910 type:complete len:132 (-) Transcript_11845:118-513(-)